MTFTRNLLTQFSPFHKVAMQTGRYGSNGWQWANTNPRFSGLRSSRNFRSRTRGFASPVDNENRYGLSTPDHEVLFGE